MVRRFLSVVLVLFSGSLVMGQLDSVKHKQFRILPLPTIGYSPETNWYFGAVALTTLDLYNDTITRVSNADWEFNYTLNKQWIADVNWIFHFRENRYIWRAENAYLHFPEYFWGIGNSTPAENEELYVADRVELDHLLLKKLKGSLYGGLGFRFQSVHNIMPEPGGLLDTGSIPGNGGGVSSGLGYGLVWDKRDQVLNPSAGSSYFLFRHQIFGSYAASEYSFSHFNLDGRYYLQTFPGHILAFQGYGEMNTGNVPFRMMGLLGSDAHMRGYYRGRYRDVNYVSGQMEYRMPVWRWIGIAAFLGAGDVFRSFGDLRVGEIKPSAGGGIRLRVDPENKTNLRFDFAVGRETSGFYVSFGESF